MTTRFNTGRLYQSDGQRITAERVDDGIIFHDHSRMIYGLIPLAHGVHVHDAQHLRSLTMANYDNHNYNYDARAMALRWEDSTNGR